MRTFIVGDIHGCHQELKYLIQHLYEKQNFDSGVDKLVFLGDYIDRGPNSKLTIDFLVELSKIVKNIVFLKGNHEDMFLNFLGFPGYSGDYFLMNGGNRTMKDYGLEYYVKSDPYTSKGEVIRTTKHNLFMMLPEEHREFFKNLKLIDITDKFIFVHAGIDVEEPLSKQDPQYMVWCRDEFYDLAPIKPFIGKTVIHGHTYDIECVFDLPYRICIDTACAYGGKLTCLLLDEENPINSKRISVCKGFDPEVDVVEVK